MEEDDVHPPQTRGLAGAAAAGHNALVDAWMKEPGAWVVGHHAVVRGDAQGTFAVCSCGWSSSFTAVIDRSCTALVDHLQAVVRAGAPVMHGDDGTAGVREPRRPLRPVGSAGAEAPVEGESRSA